MPTNISSERARAVGGLERALEAALAFLASRQLPGGEFPVLAWDPYIPGGQMTDPSVFPTAVIAWSLSFCPEAEPLCVRARHFLEGEMDRHGLWRHWSRANPRHRELPPDLDDTSCAASFLAKRGSKPLPNRSILLANRDRSGLFHTWIVPRPQWRGARHLRVTLPQLKHLPTLWLFFRNTAAAPGDVDAVVNANCLHYLGDFEGRRAVVDHLLAVLADGRESVCDKWYDNPFVVRYFLSRALAGAGDEALEILRGRMASQRPSSGLETALAICAWFNCGLEPPEGLMDSLLSAQLGSGAWPLAAFYTGGRARLPDGTFGETRPDMTRWGSEELSTAVAVEALGRALRSQRR